MLHKLWRLAVESVAYGIAGIASRFISILLVPIYTRIFDPSDYGVMSLVTTTLALLGVFAVFGFDSATTRWYWEVDEEAKRKSVISSWLWLYLSAAGVLGVTLFLLAEPASALVTGSHHSDLFRLAAVALVFQAPGNVVVNLLRMQRRAWTTAVFGFTTSTATLLLTVLFVVGFEWHLPGVFAAQAVGGVISALAAVVLLRGWASPKLFRWSRVKEMGPFAAPLVPAAAALWTVSFSDRYFLKAFTNDTEVGLYQVGCSIGALVALVTGAFQAALGPFALSIHKQPNARDIYAHVYLVYVWGGCFLGAGVAVYAPEALRLVATPSYYDASQVVSFIALSYVAIGLYYIGAIGCELAKDTRPLAVASFLAAALNVILNVALIPVLGMVGAAVATMVSQFGVSGYLFAKANKLYPIPYRVLPAVGLVALSILVVFVGTSWEFDSVLLGMGAKLLLLLVFIPALFVFGVVSIADVRNWFAGRND